VKEAGAEAVKIEGGERRLELISRLVEAEIPVIGSCRPDAAIHQRARRLSRAVGKTPDAAKQLERDAHAVRSCWRIFQLFSNPFRAISPPKSRASFASRRSHRRRPGLRRARSSSSTI